jgi:ABC-type sugar transport system ATPase subunit
VTLLSLTGITKRFGGAYALSDAGFELAAGEVHALVGANGAGKSTLSRVISGHVQPDGGEMLLDGKPVQHAGTRGAIRSGIWLVTQETSLAPDLSVLENIMLPRLGMPGRLDWGALRREGRRLLQELDQEASFTLDTPVSRLSIGQRQMVEILKALALDSRIIIFDEPTAALSPLETELLFDVMRSLVARDRGLIFVSHRMEEIFAITDRITVLREGRTVAKAEPTKSLDGSALVRLMVGQELSDIYARRGTEAAPAAPAAEPVLRVRNLACPPMVRNVSFEVRPGEIVGLAGLVGAGRSETLETIFGLRQPTSGSIEFAGQPFRAKSPVEAIRAGIGLIPEDRRRQGIVQDFNVRENLLLGHLGHHAGLGLAYETRTSRVRQLLEQLGLPERRLSDPSLLNFSGGMQQKIILARWLLLDPRLLLLDEPTRGVDIGTRSSIYALLREIAAAGVAVVVASSDFEEVIGLADRIVVMSDGTSTTELPSGEVSIEGLAMFAAPRSSAERTRGLLQALAAEHAGVAYWIGLERDRVFCFDKVGDVAGAEPGFAGGSILAWDAAAIPQALAAPPGQPIHEADGRCSLLVPMTGRRGHDLGIIGLTVPAGATPPTEDAVAARIAALIHGTAAPGLDNRRSA